MSTKRPTIRGRIHIFSQPINSVKYLNDSVLDRPTDDDSKITDNNGMVVFRRSKTLSEPKSNPELKQMGHLAKDALPDKFAMNRGPNER